MYEAYLREIRNLGYLGTWLPTDQLELGAVGLLDKEGRFRQQTTLAALGISAAVAPPGTSLGHLKHYSAGLVSVSFKAAGAAPVAGSVLSLDEAGFTVELGRKDSVVFEAVGCRHERFADVDDLGNQILGRVDAKLWRNDFVVITEVVRADSATMLIAKEGRARLEASVQAEAGASMVSIGDARLGIAVKRSTSLGMEIAARTNLTPLFTAYRVRKRFWNDGRWEVARSLAATGPLEPVSVDDVLALSAGA